MKTKSDRISYTFSTVDGKKIDIDEKGSLGILALGYKGLMAWRLRRKEHYELISRQNSPNESE